MPRRHEKLRRHGMTRFCNGAPRRYPQFPEPRRTRRHAVQRSRRETGTLSAQDRPRGSRPPAPAAPAPHVRAFPVADSRAEVIVEGQRLVDFCSNDYLGLARHPQIVAAMCEAAARTGVGSGASHLVTGHGTEHAALEEELAAFTGRERALLFSTGYMANLAAICVLADRGEVGAARQAEPCVAHRRRAAVRRALQPLRARRWRRGASARSIEHKDEVSVLATDGVFSMDGDIARLPSHRARMPQRRRPG